MNILARLKRPGNSYKFIRIVILAIAFMTLAACARPEKIESAIATGTLLPGAKDTLEPVRSITTAYLARSQAALTGTQEASRTMLAFNPPPTVAPATDFSNFADAWKRYSNESYGISFEYPAVYDISPYKDNNCGVKVSTLADGIYIDVGMRISLAITEADSSTLAEYVDNYLKDRETSEFTLTSRTNTAVGGAEAKMLEYRFGGPNRYGTVTFFKHGSRIFGLNFTAGVFCESIVMEDKESGMTELGTYFHMLESFQFTPP